MNAISHRSTRVVGALVVLAAAVLTACATTGGAVTSAAANRAAAAAPVVNFGAQAGYIVCSGGHASRFDELEQQGRICRPVASLQEIY